MWCVTSVADDAEHARDMARRQLAFYLSTPSYATVAAGTSWEHVAADVRGAFDASGRQASWAQLASLVPDETLEELAVCGTPEQARAQAEALEHELAAAGITELVFQTVGADVSAAEVIENCERIVRVLGPERAPCRAPSH
jgi:alkanesulfonate monooxygenase SsuD/methylene tetrahydromethanopterin reductase-like flavin-dependent oxidoreductase (luciferase family)